MSFVIDAEGELPSGLITDEAGRPAPLAGGRGGPVCVRAAGCAPVACRMQIDRRQDDRTARMETRRVAGMMGGGFRQALAGDQVGAHDAPSHVDAPFDRPGARRLKPSEMTVGAPRRLRRPSR